MQGFHSPNISLIISHTDPPQSFPAPKSSSGNHHTLWPGYFKLSGYHFCSRASEGTSDIALPPSVPVPRTASSSCCPKAPHSLQRRLEWSGPRAPTTLQPSSHYTLTPELHLSRAGTWMESKVLYTLGKCSDSEIFLAPPT